MIKELTPEQEAKFPEYVKKWIEIGTDTNPCDFDDAVTAIKKAYEIVNLPAPKFFIGPVNSPAEGAIVEDIIKNMVENKVVIDNDPSVSDNDALNEYVLSKLEKRKTDGIGKKLSVNSQIYGYNEYWLSFYDFFQNECNLDLEIINPLVELAKVSGWWTPLSNIAIIQHRPTEIHFDDQKRLHNFNGPAIKFRGEWSEDFSNVYAVHGVRVKKNIIDRKYKVEDIEKEENAEVRRIMIELYGQDKFIIDSGAKVISSDEFGTLYSKELNDDEPLMMVKVVNSTMEPDGSFKDYWIRVDPNAYGGLKTARAAVASTWRNNDGSFIFEKPEDYDCAIET